jgi:hypothetical protein
MRALLTILLSAALLTISACDAPHSNPFDPHSPGYRLPAPPETIRDLMLDTLIVGSARLSWTAPAGASRYLLYYGSEGWSGDPDRGADLYVSDLPSPKSAGSRQSAWIEVTEGNARLWSLFSISGDSILSQGSNILTITPLRRDKAGTISSGARSLYQLLWEYPWEYIELDLTATISDSDGIDSVWAVSELGDLGQMLLSLDRKTWTTQLLEDQLPFGSLERLIGHSINIAYRDGAGFQTVSEDIHLSRVIYTPPQTESPSNVAVSSFPRFTWLPYVADFEFTYGVEIVHVSLDYTQTLIHRRFGIPSDSTGYTVEDSLLARQRFYYWTISVEDEFGDRAISLQTTFTVENGG